VSGAVQPAALAGTVPQRRHVLAIAGALLANTGCSLLQPAKPQVGWTQGRLLVRVDATSRQAAQSVSAAFELTGDSQRGELRLLSPLGTRMATATWAPGRVLLTTLTGEQRFDTLEQLSQQALGQNVPLAALPDWLKGRPWTQAPHQARPDGFEQLGWSVNTTQQSQGRLDALRSSAPAVLLRVLIDTAA
jgi:outer membrane lipoprotein LolB